MTPFSGIPSTNWFLGQTGVLSYHPVDAGLELQINNIPHGQEDTIYGYGLFLEVQIHTYIV
jgi:hypothetical protein